MERILKVLINNNNLYSVMREAMRAKYPGLYKEERCRHNSQTFEMDFTGPSFSNTGPVSKL